MKTNKLIAITLAAGIAATPMLANARPNGDFAAGAVAGCLGLGLLAALSNPAPAPAVVYHTPAPVVYAPAPVVVAPAPVVYAPAPRVVVAPAPVVYKTRTVYVAPPPPPRPAPRPPRYTPPPRQHRPAPIFRGGKGR